MWCDPLPGKQKVEAFLVELGTTSEELVEVLRQCQADGSAAHLTCVDYLLASTEFGAGRGQCPPPLACQATRSSDAACWAPELASIVAQESMAVVSCVVGNNVGA